jgi:[ribosomal protein S5]-alanine N-acetyltransferase
VESQPEIRAVSDDAFVVHTARLMLRPLAVRDATAFHRLLVEPSVRRYLLDDTIVSRAWAEHEIRQSRALFASTGCGLWSLRVLGRPALAGFAGYRYFLEPPELQLLYALDPAHWGHGLATEAAAALVRYGFERLGFAEIRAGTDEPNSASIRVLERLGMRFAERRLVDGKPTLIYVLRRTEHVPLTAAARQQAGGQA